MTMISSKPILLIVFLIFAQKYFVHADELSFQEQSQLQAIQHRKTSFRRAYGFGGWEFRILVSDHFYSNIGRCIGNGPNGCCYPGLLTNDTYLEIFTNFFMHALNAREFGDNDCLYIGLMWIRHNATSMLKWEWYRLDYFDPTYPDFPWEGGAPPTLGRHFRCTCAIAKNNSKFGYVVRVVECQPIRQMVCMIRSTTPATSTTPTTTTTIPTSTAVTTTTVAPSEIATEEQEYRITGTFTTILFILLLYSCAVATGMYIERIRKKKIRG